MSTHPQDDRLARRIIAICEQEPGGLPIRWLAAGIAHRDRSHLRWLSAFRSGDRNPDLERQRSCTLMVAEAARQALPGHGWPRIFGLGSVREVWVEFLPEGLASDEQEQPSQPDLALFQCIERGLRGC